MAIFTGFDGPELYQKMIEYNRENSGFNLHNGIEVMALDAGYCQVGVELTKASLNPLGCAHGALIFALGDVSTGMAAAAARGMRVLTHCANINFVRPGTGSRLAATAKEVKTGRQTGVYEAEITNDEGKLVAKGTYTVFFTDELEKQKAE